jgi:hypothetical protein
MRDYADNRMEGEGRRRARRNLDGETGESYIPLSLHPPILLGVREAQAPPTAAALEERAECPEGGCRVACWRSIQHICVTRPTAE